MRETVELVGGGIYWSEDNWRTIYRRHRPSRFGRTNESVPQRVDDKVEADRIRAIVQRGGGRVQK